MKNFIKLLEIKIKLKKIMSVQVLNNYKEKFNN
jgi:hypothetical protein